MHWVCALYHLRSRSETREQLERLIMFVKTDIRTNKESRRVITARRETEAVG